MPGPGIKPALLEWPEPQQWQHQTFNPLHHQGIPCPIFWYQSVILLLSCNSLNILNTSTLLDICFINIFLHSTPCIFIPLMVSIENIFNLSFFPFMIYALWILRKFALPKFTKIFSRSFIILALTFTYTL